MCFRCLHCQQCVFMVYRKGYVGKVLCVLLTHTFTHVGCSTPISCCRTTRAGLLTCAIDGCRLIFAISCGLKLVMTITPINVSASYQRSAIKWNELFTQRPSRLDTDCNQYNETHVWYCYRWHRRSFKRERVSVCLSTCRRGESPVGLLRTCAAGTFHSVSVHTLLWEFIVTNYRPLSENVDS